MRNVVKMPKVLRVLSVHIPHKQGGLRLWRETIDPARLVFHGVVSRRRVNFSLISNTEGNRDDCCKWQWDKIHEGGLFPCI